MSATLCFHACHHKCLTMYFFKVLKAVAATYAIRLQYLHNDLVVAAATQWLLDPHSSIKSCRLPQQISHLRGSHVVRDPRDLLISAYFYHLNTNEAWCAQPNPGHTSLAADVSYQQHLRSLDMEAGLLFELDNVTGDTIRRMAAWDYTDPNILELRYEEILGREYGTFLQLFSWYGLTREQAHHGATIADQLALKNLPKDSPMARHARPGSRIGQWRDHFTPAIAQTFKQRHGEMLIRLGYSSDLDW